MNSKPERMKSIPNHEALEAYTDFYEEFKPLEGATPWKWLLDL